MHKKLSTISARKIHISYIFMKKNIQNLIKNNFLLISINKSQFTYINHKLIIKISGLKKEDAKGN